MDGCTLNKQMDIDYYKEKELIRFEDAMFYAPTKSHEVLTVFYGDYMTLPSEEERVGHHFSSFQV